jgi:hypothetical protein
MGLPQVCAAGAVVTLERTYRLQCDGCRAVYDREHEGYSTPRRARAAAHRDGWQRYQKSWTWYQDLCPACLDGLNGPLRDRLEEES